MDLNPSGKTEGFLILLEVADYFVQKRLKKKLQA